MSQQNQQFTKDFNSRHTTKMESNFGSKKSMIILVIVVGCFAVLWPKVFYPMLVGSAIEHIKPSSIDKNSGCCFVLSESDVDTIKIMSELCGNIIKEQMGDLPLTGKQIIKICQDEVFNTCGIDVSLVLQQQVRLGHTTKQILDEIRSLNGSLCLKHNFGVQPWRLGVPHIITIKNTSENFVRQERPPHVRSEMLHPAFRERGRAIPLTASPSQPPPKIIQGRPGPLPGMRPTLGGAGHVVPAKPNTGGGMNIIMPIYTVGIVIFFTYTLMKIIFKKHPETDTIYSSMDYEENYRNKLFSGNGSRDTGSCKLVVNAMSALLDQVDHEIEARRHSSEITNQGDYSGASNLSNGTVKKEEKPSVKIMGMETSESCEGGKKWQSANSSVLPTVVPYKPNEHVALAAQEIYLEKSLSPQSQILVTDSAIEAEKNSDDDDAIVLAGKMTLSVISLENENLGNMTNQNENDVTNDSIEKEIEDIIEEALGNLNNAFSDAEKCDDKTEKKETVESSESATEWNNEKITASAPLLGQQTKSSSEESGSTVLSNSNQGSVVNVNFDKDEIEEKHEESPPHSDDESGEEISDVEEEKTNRRDSNEGVERINLNGEPLLINGVEEHNGPSEEDSEDEIVEEIIEEYSEEEEDDDDDDDDEPDDKIQISRNGNN